MAARGSNWKQPLPALAGQSVLVVSPDQGTLGHVSWLLENWGAAVERADGIEAGIVALRTAGETGKAPTAEQMHAAQERLAKAGRR